MISPHEGPQRLSWMLAAGAAIALFFAFTFWAGVPTDSRRRRFLGTVDRPPFDSLRFCRRGLAPICAAIGAQAHATDQQHIACQAAAANRLGSCGRRYGAFCWRVLGRIVAS